MLSRYSTARSLDCPKSPSQTAILKRVDVVIADCRSVPAARDRIQPNFSSGSTQSAADTVAVQPVANSPLALTQALHVQLPGGQYNARTGINSREDYEKMYKQSLADPAAFWGKLAQDYYWQQKVAACCDSHFTARFSYQSDRLGLCRSPSDIKHISYHGFQPFLSMLHPLPDNLMQQGSVSLHAAAV